MSWCDTAGCGCKLNLRLKITGRRADGYHELSTLFLPLNFPADELEISSGAPGIRFRCPELPECENNLVLRAAEKFAAAANIVPAWEIVLRKRIPVAAGLGGGSSDAAATLRLLNRRFSVLEPEKLEELALSLGADVPFFLRNVPAWATGVGERLEPLTVPAELPEPVVLFPGFPVSAKWAYSALSPELIGPDEPDIRERFAAAFAAPRTADWQSLTRNDLEVALFRKFPLLELLRNDFLERGALTVRISGSGSSLYALFPPDTAVFAGRSMAEKWREMAGLLVFAGGMEL